METNRQHLIAALSMLRQCGFFEEYSSLTDDQAAGALLERLSQVQAGDPWYIQYPEYRPDQKLLTQFREPADSARYKELAAWDFSRVWSADLEADVCEGNEVYVGVVKDYARLSMGTLQPVNITERWDSEEGPITVSFEQSGRVYSTVLEYYNDWIDGDIFPFLDHAMEEAGFTASIYSETDTGQEVFFVRATEEEKACMEQKLGWSFDWDQYMPEAPE